MQYKAVIFDLDGLLIDSEPTWDMVHPKFLTKHNIPLDPELQKQTLGRGIKDVIQLYKDTHDLQGDSDALASEFRSMFYDEFLSENGFALMPGALEFVKHVADEGYVLGLATGGHTKEYVVKMLQKLSLIDYFNVIVSSDMVEKGKPDPEVFLYTARLLKTDPKSCLVFEDSPNGIMAAKSAGMRAIGINPSESIRKRLEKAGADRVYTSFGEVDLDKVAHQ